MTRERLPNRRENETITLTFGGHRFAVTIGFFPDGRPGEVFASGAKSGCDLDYLLDDACVALSLLLQHGVKPATLAKSMGRTGDGTTPASVIGALADRLGAADSGIDSTSPANGPWMASSRFGLHKQPHPRPPLSTEWTKPWVGCVGSSRMMHVPSGSGPVG